VVYVGLDELTRIEKVNVFPNPNDGHFTLLITSVSNTTFDLRIINNLGVSVYEQKNVSVNGKLEKKIELENIPNGVYSVILNDMNKQIVRKFIVQ
jgi:hypothetical protein